MKYLFAFLFWSATFVDASSQSIPVLNFEETKNIWNHQNDTVYLVNYWATWCKPCVEELPGFLQLEKELKNKKFKLILVSLDFPSQIESRLIPYLEKNKINSQVVVLDDDANVWIDKVNSAWDGNIPVTQLVINGKTEFYNSSLTYEKLKSIVIPKLR